jgi:hypothetical protein
MLCPFAGWAVAQRPQSRRAWGGGPDSWGLMFYEEGKLVGLWVARSVVHVPIAGGHGRAGEGVSWWMRCRLSIA